MFGPVQRRLTKSFLPRSKAVLPTPGSACLWTYDLTQQMDLTLLSVINNDERAEIYVASKDVPQQVAVDYGLSADLLESENKTDIPDFTTPVTKVYKTKQKLNLKIATLRLTTNSIEELETGIKRSHISAPYKLLFVRDAYGLLSVHASSGSSSTRWSYEEVPTASSVRLIPNLRENTTVSVTPLSVPVVMAPSFNDEIVLLLN